MKNLFGIIAVMFFAIRSSAASTAALDSNIYQADVRALADFSCVVLPRGRIARM